MMSSSLNRTDVLRWMNLPIGRARIGSPLLGFGLIVVAGVVMPLGAS
jgi:hypothetical protein